MVTPTSPSVGQCIISVRNGGKSFSRPKDHGLLRVLQGVDIDVRAGEFVSLIGASGSGKTTLLRMMSGLLPCSEGSISLRGEVVQGVPERIGFVFQEPALLPWRSIRDNVAFSLLARGMNSKTIKGLVDRQLELTGLSGFAAYLPRQISGGMQQRAGLARALVGEPDVLFMDEPLSALDAFTRKWLQEEVSRIIEAAGTTTVMVTHDIDEALFMSDRVVVLGSPSAASSVRGVLEVPLERPRLQANFIGDQRVAPLRDEVLSLVMKEAKEWWSAAR
jgi:ABC-type nitrate/sulfonate/bicarbonate transport system ATPase subunit